MSSTFKHYLAERFPIAPYSLLVGAMTVGATAAAVADSSPALPLGWRQFFAFLCLMLGFFHLRVFDEHKDYRKDCMAHPERVLSRGEVTLAQLRKAAWVAVIAQFALAAALGTLALIWWTAVVLFSVAMRYEFGFGGWLNKHIVIYALTHNPIVALMMVFVMVAATGHVTFSPSVVMFLLVATFTSLAFEMGRKVRAPEDEKDGQDTYTKAIGVPASVALLAVLLLLGCGCALALVEQFWAAAAVNVTALISIGVVFRFVFQPTAGGAKAVEAATTFSALLIYLIVAADVGMRLGVVWR